MLTKAILKALKFHSIQTLIVWLVIWVYACFIGWNLYNPLELFIRIPTEGVGYRVILIMFLTLYTLISISIRVEKYVKKEI